GIIHVTLSSRHRFHMRCIRQDQCKTPVENVPDRLPIDAGRFHRYMRTSRTFQPFREFKQSVRRRGKSTHRTLHLSCVTRRRQTTTSVLCTSTPAHLLCNVFIATSSKCGRREALAV